MTFDWSDIDSFSGAIFDREIAPDRVLASADGTSHLHELTPELGEGYVEIFSFTDGLAMVIFNCRWHRGRTFEVRDNDRTRFSFTLDLNISMDVGSEVIDASTPGWQLMNNAADVVTQETVTAGSKTVWVTLAFEREYLDRFLAHPQAVGRLPVFEQLRKNPEKSIVRTYPLDHQLNLITSNLILLNAADEVYVALARAKASELISHALDRLLTLPKSDESGHPKLRARDREAIRLAHDLLVNNLAEPPTIRELCTAVGVNRNKLHYGFREEFGMSPQHFLEEQRLAHAYERLHGTDQLIYQIAADVGYTSQGSFATAFKRRYGVKPSSVRAKPVAGD